MMAAVLGFQCESTNGYEHSLFNPYNSFFHYYFISPAVYISPPVYSLHFTLTENQTVKEKLGIISIVIIELETTAGHISTNVFLGHRQEIFPGGAPFFNLT